MTSIYKDDSWSIGEARVNDLPLIIRSRTELPAITDRESHSNLIVITWPYEAEPSGMPGRDAIDQIIRFEDAIQDTVEKRSGVQVASITGDGIKEWRYYTQDNDQFMADFNDALAGHPAYPISIQMFADPEWGALAELLPPDA